MSTTHRILFAAAAVSLLAWTGSAGAGDPQAGSLVLRLVDLPHASSGWRRDVAGVLDNTEAARQAGATRAVVAAAGRVTGYFVVFHRRGCCVDQVGSVVDVFDSDASADAIFGGSHSTPDWLVVPTNAKIGQELTLLSGTLQPPYRGAGARERAWRVMWRSGRVLANLFVGGVAPTAKEALALARAEQMRIEASLDQSSTIPTARTGEPYAGSTRSGKP